MPDYKNGKIYAIRASNIDDIYIGSTCEKLSRRLAQHRYEYIKYFNSKTDFLSSFLLLGCDDYYIELIEDCPCDNKEQLTRREGEIIRATSNCVNKVVSGRTRRENYIDNKEYYKDKHAKYYEQNRESLIQKNKEYRAKARTKLSYE